MKYIIVDDEHELYKRMYADLFKTSEYSIEEIPRMVIPKGLRELYKIHFSDKINRRIFLPFKDIWRNCYRLHKYPFDSNEKYIVIFLNGSLKYHFSKKYLCDIKEANPNVKYAMVLYDSSSNPAAKRAIDLIPMFDYVFSFDEDDCKKLNFTHIYSTFSKPDFIESDESYRSKAFFIGFGQGRLKILKDCFKKITNSVHDCKFYICGVKKEDIEEINGVSYNKMMTYDEELKMTYNTDCVVEVLKDGQSGITLRTCEAICFNKKLLTNNNYLKKMPFYDERYMKIFNKPDDIDIDFLKKDVKVQYNDNDYFSPLKIIEALEKFDF